MSNPCLAFTVSLRLVFTVVNIRARSRVLAVFPTVESVIALDGLPSKHKQRRLTQNIPTGILTDSLNVSAFDDDGHYA